MVSPSSRLPARSHASPQPRVPATSAAGAHASGTARDRCILIVIATAAYLAVAMFWIARGMNPITGDEPHYLVGAHALIYEHSLDVSRVYGHDPWSNIFGGGTHTVSSGERQYSAHGLAIELLIALPYRLFGVTGAKAALCVVAGSLVSVVYLVLLQITADRRWSLAAALVLALSLPNTMAAGQIYPDLLVGFLQLYIFYQLARGFPPTDRSWLRLLSVACAVGALPWMQNRHLAVGAAFGTAVMVRLLHDSRDADDGGPAHHRLAVLRSSRFLVPLALMVGLQLGSLLYSWLGIHAFGPSAPPGFMGWYSAMIGLGLHLDRFHGIFFQNPLLFAAIAGLPVFVRRTPTLAILWATVYVLSVVPVCLTRFGYGGWAFAGRYGWDVAPLWIVPFAHFVAWLLEQRRGRAVLAVLLMVSALVQVLLAARWITTDGLLIEGVWRPSMVDGFYGDLSGKLPMFSGLQELLVHRPNWLWVGLALLCLFITRMTRKRWKMSLVVTSAAIVLVGLLLISPSIHRPFEIVGARLPMTTGRNDGSARIAVEGTDAPGFVTFGPYVMLTAGCYELQLSYAAAYPDGTHPLSWDHYSGGQILSQGLVDAAERGTVLRQVVRVPPGDQIDGFELRVWFGGKGRIRIDKLVIVESPAC